MTTHLEMSNVYYLPTEPVVAPPRAPRSRWSRLGLRFARAWWRVRITATEIRAAIRRPRSLVLSEEAVAFLDRLGERRPRYAAPARVIDFAAARARLRPAAGP